MHIRLLYRVESGQNKGTKMSKFLRSIDENLQKHITVITEHGNRKTYASLTDMPKNELFEYVFNAIASCDNNSEQFAATCVAIKCIVAQENKKQRV